MADNYFLRELKGFGRTFTQIDSRFIFIILADFLLVVLLIVGTKFLSTSLNNLMPPDYPLQSKIQSLDYMTYVEAGDLRDVLVDFRNKIYGYSFLFILFALFVYTASRYVVYSLVDRARLFAKGWLRNYGLFVVLNLALAVLALVAYTLFLVLLYAVIYKFIPLSQPGQAVLFIIIMYFVLLIHYFIVSTSLDFMRNCSVRQSISGLFRRHVKKTHLALLPVLFMFLLILLLNIAVIVSTVAGEMGSMFLISLLLFCFVSFMRMYYRNVMDAVLPAKHEPAAKHRHAAKHGHAAAHAAHREKKKK
ncbi:hypothetical protein KY359_00100 [Candidatus Woesearchaeota archaeon]|nr:hypothetical protein [Candidatus Woesearchaeota archaeon]